MDKQNVKEPHQKSDSEMCFLLKMVVSRWSVLKLEDADNGCAGSDVFPGTYWNINAWKEQTSIEIIFFF